MTHPRDGRPEVVPVPYPITLDVRGRRCVVVGDTPAAAERVARLREAGADVVAVPLPFEPRSLDGAQLVLAATGSNAIDASVAEAAEARGLWVNAIDQPPSCSFHLASVARAGSLTVAVSSGGAAPKLAVWMRKLVESLLPDDGAALVAALAEARTAAKAAGIGPSTLDWDTLIAPFVAAVEEKLAARAPHAGAS